MSRMFFNRTSHGRGALALTAMLAACGGGDPQSGTQSEGVTLAQASPAPVGESVTSTTDLGTIPSVPVKITYADAESVFKKGQYPEATELFAVYVAQNPENGFGHYMLGLSAWKSGDRGRAEQALTRAVELDSGSVKARTNLGRVLLEQGRAVDALPHLEKAVELKPESYETWRVLGNVRGELGKTDEALEAYRQALMRNEKDAWSMNNYGLVLIQIGSYEEAVQPLARAVELVPGSPVFQNNLGIALERSGHLGSAVKAFTTAVEADSTYVKAKTSLDRVQTRLGSAEGEMIDLAAYAQSFVEEIQRWRTTN